jgi:hypothetical protein
MDEAVREDRSKAGTHRSPCFELLVLHPRLNFLSVDSQLTAPVRIGKGAYVAAGSSITDDVSPESLAIGRGKQPEEEMDSGSDA